MKFEDVEKARINYKNKVKKLAVIVFSMLISIVVLTLTLSGINSTFFSFAAIMGSVMPIIVIFAIISIFVFTFAISKDAKEYKRIYKAYFVEQTLKKVFSDLYYNHEVGIERSTLNSTEMINTGDRYSSNDFTSGKYKDVSFCQADVHIQVEDTDSEGRTRYKTIFMGRWMIFEFPKKFNFKLEVFSKNFGARRIPGKGDSGRKIEKIEVESPDFNKKYKIFAEDGFEAFYLLDPSFINNIEELGDKYNKQMLLCFIENKLYVGLNDGKDSFEPPSIFKEMNEDEEMKKVANDLYLITDFIDKLKLDHKVFKE